MTRRRFVPSAICVLAWLAALCHPSAGHAGAYSVRACHSDGVSAVWVPSYTANTVAYVQCPGGVGSNAGLIARNVTASGVTPVVRSGACESFARPRSWAARTHEHEATQAHPRAGHPQAA